MELPTKVKHTQKIVSLLNYLTEIDHAKINSRLMEFAKDIAKRSRSFRPMSEKALERQIILAYIDDLSWLSISLGHWNEMIEMHRSISRCVLGLNSVWLRSQIMLNPGKKPRNLGSDGSVVKAFTETSKYCEKVNSIDQCYNQLIDLLTVENISTIANVLKEEGL